MVPERIALRINKHPDGCWQWTGPLNDGYGSVNINGERKKAHRAVYELLRPPIPAGLDLDHLCRNRACVNPQHLEPVTRSENLRRSPLVRLNNGNAAKSHCARGHAYDDENTYYRPGGGRTCRACNAECASRTKKARMIAPGGAA